MKTYPFYKLFLCFIGFSMIQNCEKMIEVEEPSNQISSQKVFEDVQTADAALAALYGMLWDNSPVAGDQTGKLMGSYTDDLDYYVASASTGLPDIYQNTQEETNPQINTYWAKSYQCILTANTILEGIRDSQALPQKDKNRIKGEALLARSLVCFYLQQIFGDIPFPSSTDYKINQSIGKTSGNQVLTLLENDVIEAISLLSDDYRNTERIFLNRKAGQLLLAKIYMTQHQWIKAEPVLKDIVTSPLYIYENDLSKVFNKNGKHIIWQLKPKNSGNATKEASAYYFNNTAPTSYALSTSLINVFTASDLRKQNWMAKVQVGQNVWYRADKYKNRTSNTTEYSIVFRLEEAYLLLAETYAQQDKVALALPYLNASRLRAGLSAIQLPISKNDVLNEILLESRKEFFTEMGHRFLDMKRYEILNTLQTVKPNWKSYHALWPIPQKELLLNPNLNPQNEGY